MFESLLASLLDKYASEYLEGIDSKSANLSIWKGDVSLRNLKVKTSAFDELKLPVTVRYGYLEELTLKIPWKDLKTKPVNVILKGLYVVLAPVAQDCLVSSSPEDLQEALRKKARAAVDNLIKSEVAQKIPGFTERLLARIVDNIQIEFERLHISYIDTTVTSGSLSCGITIQGFTAKSADANGHEAFVHESRILRKRVDLRCLSVYCNPVYDILQKINLNQPFISTKAAQDAANSYLRLLVATSAQDASPLLKHILMPLCKVSDGSSSHVLAVSSASIAPVGLYALPDSDVFPTRAVAGDVRGGSSARSSPSSSPSLGPATPPPARSAFDIVSDAQKRALK
jgi:hypothetical protein